LKADPKTPLRRKLTFGGLEKVREMFDRFVVDKQLEDRAALEYGINMGGGSVWLSLSDEQYRKLK